MISERGSAVVEFAIVLPLVIVVLLAGIEVLAVSRTHLQLVQAAREGAREAAATPDPAAAVAAVQAALGPGLSARALVSVERPHVVGERAVVTVRVRHRMAALLLGGISIDLSARSVMRVEQ